MNKVIDCKDCQDMYECGTTYLGGCIYGKEWPKEEPKKEPEEPTLKIKDTEVIKDFIKKDDLVEEANKSLYEMITEAYHEALKNNIKVNTIAINDHLVKVKSRFYSYDGCGGFWLPPMICGLEAYLTNELPDDYAFAVLEAPKTERERVAEEAIERFIRRCRNHFLGGTDVWSGKEIIDALYEIAKPYNIKRSEDEEDNNLL